MQVFFVELAQWTRNDDLLEVPLSVDDPPCLAESGWGYFQQSLH